MIKKFIIAFSILTFLAIGTIIAIPFLFKDEINELLKEQINNELKINVDYSDYELSILSSFPDFKFSLKNLVVIGQNYFEGDTLALMKELDFNIDAKKLYQDKELQIHTIYIDQLKLKTIILPDSTNSLDIFKDKTTDEVTKIDTTKERFINMNLESLVVKNTDIFYENRLKNQIIIIKDLNTDAQADYFLEKAKIKGKSQIAELMLFLDSNKKEINLTNLELEFTGDFFNNLLNFDLTSRSKNLSYKTSKSKQLAEIADLTMHTKGQFKNNQLVFNTQTKTSAVSFKQKETVYLNKAIFSLNGDITADFNNSEFTFKDNKLIVNQLPINYFGKVKLGQKDINIDLDFNTTNSSFKDLLSAIPAKFSQSFKEATIKGIFDLKGYVKGIYNSNLFPLFKVNANINKAYVKKNNLPSAIENIAMKVEFSSLDNRLNKMNLIVPNAHFTIENEPMDISLKILDIKNDPNIDLKAKGNFDLAKLPIFYKIDDLKKIEGSTKMDISFNGKKSTLKSKDYNKINFQGDMIINNMIYHTKKTKQAIKVNTVALNFTSQFANMKNLSLQYGQTDIKANGKLENLLNYLFSNGVVKGNLNFTSNKIDLNELLGKKNTKSKSKEIVENTATKVPKRIDFTTTAQIKELYYDDILLNSVKGEIKIKDESIYAKAISANMLGGNAIINGKYDTKNTTKPLVDFKYDVKGFDIKQTFKQVNTIQKIAPIAAYLNGKFNSTFSFNSTIKNNYKPDLSVLNGIGNVKVVYADFLNFPIFKSVSNAIKIPMLDLDKAKIKNAWTVFKVRDGKVDVEPFDYNYKDIKMHVFGSNGFNKSIDYTMRITVPSNKFGKAANIANDFLKKNKIPLLDLAVPKNITFHLNLSGFLQNPIVKIIKISTDGSDKGIVEQVADSIKDKAKEEAERIKKEAEERTRKEIEKLKKEAEKRAKEAAEKLKKELEEKLQKEIEEKLKKETEGKLEDLLKDNLPNFGF